MKKKLIKNVVLAGLLVFSGGAFMTSCSQGAIEETPLTIVGQTSVEVGKTVSLSTQGASENDTFTWVSANEAIATVDSNGTVTGVKEGTTTISVYKNGDYLVFDTVTIYVYEPSSSGEALSTLTLDTSSAKLVFKQGDEFSTEGLIVKKDGVEVSDYSTNPARGTRLVNLGTMTIYVSLDGAESVSYEITIEASEEDLSLVNFVENLSTASVYKYEISVEGEIDYGGDSLASEVSYEYTYGDDAFYYRILVDGAPFEGQDYGYVDTSKGVMKFVLDDEIVKPLCYISMAANAKYRDISSSSLYLDLVADDMPRRKTGDYFEITDQGMINVILGNTNLMTSNIYANLEEVRAYLEDSGALRIEIDCGLMGTITERYSEIGTATVPYIADYLTENGEDITVSEELTKMVDLVKSNNYVRDLGSGRTQDGTTINIGQRHYTENYVYDDYTDEYIAYAATQGVTITDGGSVYSETLGKYIYTFDVVDGAVTNVAQGDSCRNLDTFYEDLGYPSIFGAWDKLEMFEYKNVPEYGGNMYLNQGDDYPTEIYDYLGFSADTTGLFPYGIGLAGSLNEVDALSSLNVIAYVFDFSGTNYCYGFTLTSFGVANVDIVDNYLAALA